MRYVDDTFVIQQEDQKQNFLEHINKVDPAIKFTAEGNQENGAIPFIDNSENSNTQKEPTEETNSPSSNTTERAPKDKYSKGHIVIPYT